MKPPSTQKTQGKAGIRIRLDATITRFLLSFLVISIALYFLTTAFELYIPLFSQASTAKVLHRLTGMLGMEASLDGTTLSFGNFSLIVVRQCTGVFELIAIASCIAAYRAALKRKLAGIAIALPIIYVFNMARMVILTLVGVHFNPLFDAVHKYVFQVTFVLFVLAIWVLWIDWVRIRGKGN
ncbi:hypothetical protein A3K63_04985 [Candidatus Micrarchaeota archaeon RBG_16_49_10]|nr:MAG: hypothetical protein A3K63_04985 [Candidatus Micrarchaeota archaeon RBG_16_49_10]